MPTCPTQGLSSSDVIAICAVLVALFAMIATFWQASIARKHAEISVTPHLDFHTKAVWGQDLSIELENNGLGPAVVEGISLTFDNTSFELVDGDLPVFIKDQLNAFPYGKRWTIVKKGSPLSVGNSITMLALSPNPANAVESEQAEIFIKRFNYKVRYTSLYGKSFSAEVRT